MCDLPAIRANAITVLRVATLETEVTTGSEGIVVQRQVVVVNPSPVFPFPINLEVMLLADCNQRVLIQGSLDRVDVEILFLNIFIFHAILSGLFIIFQKAYAYLNIRW